LRLIRIALGHATASVGPALIVIAKAPVAGRVKTRLTPPCTPAQAATLARAALQDTLDTAARATRAGRRVIALDGSPGTWLPDGFEVIPQRGRGLGERLASAFTDVGGPAFLVGMDTPQLTPELLDAGLEAVADGDSAFGAARDGGYWGIGLHTPDPAVFAGVPMSSARTGAVQRAQMTLLGLRPRVLPPLLDVDTFADAPAVAAEAPASRFAAELAAISAALEAAA
jgi:rSAM/selenodomain-associated transferase 1